jgi:hypothetical protein
MSGKVPEFMAIAAEVATGNRKRVLENGPYKPNSEDEDIPDMKPDAEKGVYTFGMDPLKGPIMLTPEQVAAQKAAAQAQKGLRKPPQPQSLIGGSSDDDDPDGSEKVWSMSKQIFRPNKNWKGPKAPSVPALPAPEAQRALPAPEPMKALPAASRFDGPRQPTPVSSDTEDQGFMTEDQKRYARVGKKLAAAASQKAPAGKPTAEAKASKPVTGQESPETKVSHPMATRRQASRAGSLRPGGGSGKTATCVASGNPSKTWVVIFFLRGGFLPLAIQRRSMAQRDNRHTEWVLGMHHPAAGPRAAVRCSQVPRWGQTK